MTSCPYCDDPGCPHALPPATVIGDDTDDVVLVPFMPVAEEDGGPSTCSVCFATVPDAWTQRHVEWHNQLGHLDGLD